MQYRDFDAIPRGRYGANYADPPWYHKCWGAKGTGRGAFSHYNVMQDEDLLAMPVHEIAAKDCLLYLWVPLPARMLGMEVLKAWGFEYRTVGFTWIKPLKGKPSASVVAKWGASAGFRITNGAYTRANPEECLIGRRGKPKIRMGMVDGVA